MDAKVDNLPQDALRRSGAAAPERRDGSSDLDAGTSGGGRLVALHLAGVLAAVSSIGAIFALQVALQPPTAYALQAVVGLGLIVAVSGLVRMGRRALARLSQRLRADLSRREAQLNEVANRDDLTQIGNRRFFYARLEEELAQSVESKRPMAMLMMDVDGLKAINDEFGHLAGDSALASFAGLVSASARPTDVVARLGGDEFAIILPNTDPRGARALASRLWNELEHTPVHRTPDTDIYLGVSIGLSGFPWKGDDPEALVHWADADLYANKHSRKGIAKGFFGRDGSQFASGVVDVLCAALDIRDKLTHRHCQRVAAMIASLGRSLGLSEAQLPRLANAALLHDIGKIGVGDSVLSKPSALDDKEWQEIRRHPQLGYELLKGFDFLKEPAEIVLAHHERYDGRGYPRGLEGEQIPFGARVFAVVDAFDAMTSRRPYRGPRPAADALQELTRNGGTQFDVRIVRAFVQAVDRDLTQRRDDPLAVTPHINPTGGRRRWSSAVNESSPPRTPAAPAS